MIIVEYALNAIFVMNAEPTWEISMGSKHDKYYYKDGTTSTIHDSSKILHRVDGPAIEWADGEKWWYFNGKLHREDGPAIEHEDGSTSWWVDDKRHRLDGPAIEGNNGYNEWWIDGNYISEQLFDNHPKVQHYAFQIILEEVLNEE
jgi:hypothetical protein